MANRVITSNEPFRVKLRPYQDRFVFSKAKHPAMVTGWACGKRIDIETEIKTTKGWKKLKDIKRGDYVFGADGKPTKVLKAHSIVDVKEGYNLYFSSGEEVKADAEHLWYTINNQEIKKKKGSIKTTKEIIETIRTKDDYTTNHRIPVCSPIEQPIQKLPIEPYTFGAWLGNGSSYGSMITTIDADILRQIKKEGYSLRQYTSQNNNFTISNDSNPNKQWKNKKGQFENGTLTYILREKLKVKNNKHIPECYLNASINQRMELLRGLMDTDGYADERGCCEYTTVKIQLANDILELISSLGYKTRVCVGLATINKRIIGKKYRLHFKTKDKVFHLKRKQIRLDNSSACQISKRLNRYILKYDICKNVKMRCLTVDNESGLFLIGRTFIPTHNTLCGILRADLYSKLIPDNLGIIFRKEYTDLRSSTLQDYIRYTGKRPDSHRDVTYPNGSKIMFRHIEELNNIQNVNLGWFFIEQAEELPTDTEFFTLFGRLRRKLKPTKEFTELGLPVRNGWIIANAGSEWIRKVWVVNAEKDPDFHLIQATTYDNACNLEDDFLSGLLKIKAKRPEIYRRFVLNDWDISDDSFIVIPLQRIKALEGVYRERGRSRRLVSCDPSLDGDDCVIYVMEEKKIIYKQILHYRDTMKIAGVLNVIGVKFKTKNYVIDSIGIGKGVADRVVEINQSNNVIYFNSSEKSTNRLYFNKKAQAWWEVSEQILDKRVPEITDPELVSQLSKVPFEMRQGRIKIRSKPEVKKIIGRSPDEADAFIQGIYAFSDLPDEQENREYNLDYGNNQDDLNYYTQLNSMVS